MGVRLGMASYGGLEAIRRMAKGEERIYRIRAA